MPTYTQEQLDTNTNLVCSRYKRESDGTIFL